MTVVEHLPAFDVIENCITGGVQPIPQSLLHGGDETPT
jgi:hypothetical protein